MAQELQRSLEKTKPRPKGPCWGREGSPVLQSLVGPFQAFKHPTCTDFLINALINRERRSNCVCLRQTCKGSSRLAHELF